MAVKVVPLSCLVAFLGYIAFQELTIVTEKISLQVLIPAKKTDVFHLVINPETFLKFHPLCINVANITKSQGRDGTEFVQFVFQERVNISVWFYKTSIESTWQLRSTIMQAKAVIETRGSKLGGFWKLTQRWQVADCANGHRDNTVLLEDYFELTTFRLLVRFAKGLVLDVHSTLCQNIRQHFLDASKKSTIDKSEQCPTM